MTPRAWLGSIAVMLSLACSDPKAPTKQEQAAEGGKSAEDGKTSKPDTETVAGIGNAALNNGQPSLEALGRSIVAALQAKDGRALMALAVTKTEFEGRLFGALVSDPQARRTGAAAAWKNLSSASVPKMTAALEQHGGKGYEFVSLESTDKEELAGLVLHKSPRLTVKDASGATLELKILGEVLEHPASETFLVLSFTH